MFRIIIAVLILGISTAQANETAKYICPMHPQIVSDKPGTCPICGMDLVLAPHDDEQGNGAHSDKTYSDKVQGDETQGESAPVIAIPANTLQKMGVRTEKVVSATFGDTLRVTGNILANERLRWDMASQVEGRVEDLKFAAEGDRVKKGQPFYTLASTELQRLQSDYLLAVRGGTKQGSEGAARRLRLMGVDDSVIASLREKGDAFEHVPFSVPADGVLTKIEIRNGHYLKVGDEIGHIQDVSTVWVDAALPESSLMLVKEGDSATVTVSGQPKPYKGTVEHIHPLIKEETRTGIARLVVENPEDMLRPGGYATVEFRLNPQPRIAVPEEAVLRSSGGEYVVVALGEGKFQPRQVHTGMSAEGKTEILYGLKEGEEVVVSGQFLLDAESNLREGLKKLGGSHAE